MKNWEIKDIYPLSPMQEALLFHSLYEQGDVYFEQMIFSIEGKLDIGALERSLNQVISRYDILRTIFIYDKINKPRQVVLKERTLKIDEADISDCSTDEQNRRIQEFAEADRRRSFDLSKDLLLRLTVIRRGEESYELMWSNHHILIDGWCLGIVLQEWFSLYQQETAGLPAKLGKVVPYKRYIKWLESQDQNAARQYWRSYLSGYGDLASISGPNGEKPPEEPVVRDEVFTLDADLTQQLVQLSRKYQVTMSSLIQAIWGVILQYYCNTEDVVFGSIVSGRSPSIADVDKIVGLFINAVPVRVQSGKNMAFSELAAAVHHSAALSEEHSFLSLAEVQAEGGGAALFDHLVVYENYPSSTSMFDTEASGLDFRIKAIEVFEHTNYDLNISVGPGEEMLIKINYNERVYPAKFIQRLYGHWVEVCCQVTANPNVKISQLHPMTREERELLASFNETFVPYPRDKTLIELFMEQVRRQPEQPAVIFGEEQWTYAELNDRVSQWAGGLRRQGVERGDVVGLLADRSVEMIIGILAILRAGAAYIPLDPTFPADRMAFMLRDSGARFLLKLTNATGWSLPEFEGLVISPGDWTAPFPADESLTGHGAGSPAYMMYTSGSTGTPKGVVVTHRNIVKTVLNNGYVELDSRDRILQISNYAFDGAVFDIFGALLNGAALVLLSKEALLDASSLAASFDRHEITVAFMTTALFNTLVDLDPDCLRGLRHVLFGGERVSVRHVNKALRVLGEGRLLHMYGPTETTVFATCSPVREGEVIPIGRPIHNTTAYVLDIWQRLMPAGVPGELYIGGEGLSAGYLGRSDLTTECFVDNPFRPGEKMYRTGDLVRQLPDGQLEFLDRLDHQVKIRGHRIELGEIEEKLKGLPDIQDVFVTAFQEEGQSAYLCAYIVTGGKPLSLADEDEMLEERISGWKRELKASLPEYMVPAVFELLPSFPLTSNGKIDRKALPKPTTGLQRSYSPPTDAAEEKLAAIWSDILGCAPIGREDHFFELGGHSLKAMVLAARVHKELEVKISLQEVFRYPLLREMAQHIQSSRHSTYTAILPAPSQDTYPVSSAQKRVYIAQQLSPESTSYNMPMVLEVEGSIDAERLERAFLQLLARHEALRTIFLWDELELRQQIVQASDLSWQLERRDLEDGMKNLQPDVKSKTDFSYILSSFIRPFDLSGEPLLRAALVSCSDTRSLLLIDVHHIVSDGVSTGILYRDLVALYEGKALPPLSLQYKDYAVYEQGLHTGESYAESRNYWVSQYAGKLPESELWTDFVRPSVRSYEGRTISFQLDPDLTDRLKKLASRYEATLYIVLLAAYNLLLSKYSGQEDIVVGTPVAGRNHEDVQGLVGMFVNTLAIRNEPRGSLALSEYIKQVKSTVIEAYEHAEYPLEELLEELELSRDLSRHPLFDTLFVLQNMDIAPLELPGTVFRAAEWEWNHAKFDMTWAGRESEQGIDFTVEFAVSLYREETIRQMIGHFTVLLQALAEASDTSSETCLLQDIEMLTSEDQIQLASFAGVRVPYPQEHSIVSLFSQSALAHADRPALIHDDQVMTYRELADKSDQLAAALIGAGVVPGDAVGLLSDRSMEMIIAILGILKTGAAYVPLDATFPAERRLFMLADSGAKRLVVSGGMSLAGFDGETLHVAELLDQEGGNPSSGASSILPHIRPNDAIYIMYTSGSTGRPKGVVATHGNVVKTMVNNGYVEITEQDRMLQASNYAFDASTLEIYGALLNGASLVLISREQVLDAAGLASTIERQRITLMFMTTALFNTMVDYDAGCLRSVRKLFFGGESASRRHIVKALEHLGENRIVHAYGPTETTVFATTFPIDFSLLDSHVVPIGRPINNTQLYVLNRWGQQQPVGLLGELYIGGDGVALGYLKQKDLTAERFLANPFAPGERMYRTGDLVRWLPDGQLEFLRRVDHQVKIRGNRIELGEIESRLRDIAEISEAVVLPIQNEGQWEFLCAYLVLQAEEGSMQQEGERTANWKKELRQTLPDYMVPAKFIIMEALPLTANGKVDLRALPKPELGSNDEHAAPQNHLEEQLQSVWAEVLGVNNPGVEDHFFELGGHSLKAMLLVAKVRQVLDVKVNLKDIFNYPTIRELARMIGETGIRYEHAEIPSAPHQETYPASSAQKRIYVVQQYDEDSTSYNMPMIFRLEGQLDLPRLEEALYRLMERHEMLRTSFHHHGENVRQQIHPAQELDWRLEITEGDEGQLSLSERDQAEQAWMASCIRPFDLQAPPLWRAFIRRQSPSEHLLMIDIHHIVFDGMSTGILFNELIQLYQGEGLPPLRIQYKDYAVWEQTGRTSESYLAAEKYWDEVFEEEPSLLQLPIDYARSPGLRNEGAQCSHILDEGLARRVKQAAAEQGVTLFMFLMSAYHILLSKYSGEEDIVAGTPLAGRDHADTSAMIGMFVKTLALRTRPKAELTIQQYMEQVRDHTLASSLHSEYPLEALLDRLDIPRTSGRQPLFDTLFVLQNMDRAQMELPGIRLEQVSAPTGQSKFDMTWAGAEHNDGLIMTVEYNKNLFRAETIRRMLKHYEQVLLQLAECSREQRIREITLLSPEEREQLAKFAGVAAEYPSAASISRIFAEQVQRTPDHTALRCGVQQLTYRELASRADLLADVLRRQNVGRGDLVALLADRSVGMIVAIMGILRSGAAYVPLDPGIPAERQAYILENSGARLLLAESSLPAPDGYEGQVILLNEHGQLELTPNDPAGEQEAKASEGAEEPGLEGLQSEEPQATDPAYVMYTSGSTGTPKGVVTTHRNVVKTSINNGFIEVTPADRMLQLSNYAFDGSTYEIFGALLNGATLVLIRREDVLNASELGRILEQERITSAFMTAALFNTVVDWDVSCLKHVRKLFFGGEAASRKHVLKALDYLGAGRIANGYGPTETTIFATTYTVDEGLLEQDGVPIGRPIHNTKLYVLNKWGQPQPVGVPGELYIGGDGLAQGYLNQPELTAERFQEGAIDLVDTAPGERLYQTGDWVRWLPDGNLEYLDRLDRQVKIRGHRIELGEVEGALNALPEVREAVVVPGKDEQGHSFLAAYIVLESGSIPSRIAYESTLRDRLEASLPDYMIPSIMTFLDRMPLNRNGKVDRRALPKPELSRTKQYLAPTNETERMLAEIWADVLGMEQVGIQDHFFELGGHSLKAMNLIARVQQAFHVRLSLQDVFSYTTVQQMAHFMLTEGREEVHHAISAAPKQEAYPASSAQRRIYVTQQLDRSGTGYNMPMAMELEGELDASRLQEAFLLLIERHESLRTSFEMADGELRQRIHEVSELGWKLEEVQDEVDSADRKSMDERMQEFIAQFIRPFKLSEKSLLRAGLLRLSRLRHLLVLDIHHSVSDGISMGIIMADLLQLYEGNKLAPLALQYKDYAVWEHRRKRETIYGESQRYWLDEYQTVPPSLSLPYDHPAHNRRTSVGDSSELLLGKELTGQLEGLAGASGTTLYAVLLSAYSILLSKYSGEEDMAIGAPVAGRPHADTAQIVGMFVNTLALRLNPEAELPLSGFISQVREKLLLALEHDIYPLEELLEHLELSRDSRRHPLFDTLFVLQNMESSRLESASLGISEVQTLTREPKFDMTWGGHQTESGLRIMVEYDRGLFEAATVQRMLRHFETILQQMVKAPQMRIQEIRLLTEEEQQQLIGFAGIAVDYPRDKTIPAIFEAQVQRAPEQTALVFGDVQVSYRELGARADKLARTLKRQGVECGDTVGLMAGRSIGMIVAIMGILRAGAAYVPLDPAFPQPRLAFMLEDSGARIVLAESGLLVPDEYQGEVIPLNEHGQLEMIIDLPAGEQEMKATEEAVEHDQEGLQSEKPQATDPAYIMYTSGSTGTPKGVVTTHRNVVKTSINNGFIEVTPADRMLQLSNYAFDGSTYEIFGALLNGATLVLIRKEDMLNASELGRILEQERITLSFMTTALFNTVVDWGVSCLQHIRKLFFGGETASRKHVLKALDYLGAGRIANSYGPTETTVFATTYTVDERLLEQDGVPIGRPIHNTKLYVLNKWGQPQPVGVPGELYISGDGLAQGYLNQPELTAERFQEGTIDLVDLAPGERLYQTGDWVRWLPDGNLEYLDRLDRQVKIRGHRIELGEVEGVLNALPEVREAVVVPGVDEQGHSFLTAYVTPAMPDADMTQSVLREKLRPILPEYMLPAVIMILQALPLTSNGKVDRRALPKPERKLDLVYAAPEDELERKMAGIWAEILEVERVGINDSFFELGGHSLKAMVLVSRIQQEFQAPVDLQAVFEHPTVRMLCQYTRNKLNMERQHPDYDEHIVPAPEQEVYPAAPYQAYSHEVSEQNTEWNMPMAFRIEGALDTERLEQSFRLLIHRHEALRTALEREGERIVQRIYPEVSFQLQAERVESEADKIRIMADYIQPFDLSSPPLLRAKVLQMNQEEYVLLLDMHHGISDGTSVGILLSELFQLYDGLDLAPVSVQYKDYVFWWKSRLDRGQYSDSKQFWMDMLEGYTPCRLPVDIENADPFNSTGDSVVVEVPEPLFRGVRSHFTSQITDYTLLYAMYLLLLHLETGQTDLMVGTYSFGRQHPQLQETVGLFINSLPIRTRLNPEESFAEFVQRIQHQLIEVFKHQQYPFEYMLEDSGIPVVPGLNSLFDTMFTMNNFANRPVEAGELTISGHPYEWKYCEYDIYAVAHKDEERVIVHFNYRTSLFSASTMNKLAARYVQLFDKAARNPEIRIGDMEYVSMS